MPYLVLVDGATIPKTLNERTSRRDPNKKVPLYTDTVYKAGDVVKDDDVAQVVKDKLESGDENVSALLAEISQKEADEASKGKAELYVAAFQAENAGDVNEPRKAREGLTRLDLEERHPEKGEALPDNDGEIEETDQSYGDGQEEADTEGKRRDNAGEIDEPRKDQQGYTKRDLDNPKKAEVVKKATRKSTAKKSTAKKAE